MFVEDAAQSLTSAAVEVGELAWSVMGRVGARVVDDAVVWSVRGVGLFVLARDVKQGVVGFSRGSCVLFTGGLVDEKSRPPMPVVQPVLAWRADMLALIADGDQVQAADALLSLTY